MADRIEIEVYRCPRCGRIVLEPGLFCGGTLIGRIVAEHEPTEMKGLRIEWSDGEASLEKVL
jgi:hypothetical protein